MPRDLIQSYIYSQLEADGEILLENIKRSNGTINREKINIISHSGHLFQIKTNKKIVYSDSLQGDKLPFLKLPINSISRTITTSQKKKKLLMWSKQISLNNHRLQLAVAQDMTQVNSIMKQRRETYLIGFSISIILFILLQSFLIKKIIKPVDKAKNELKEIQRGQRKNINQKVPIEFQTLVDEFNALLNTNEQRLQRSRNATGNLAHSLKTPLTVLTQLSDSKEAKEQPILAKELQQATLQMQNIINHELAHSRLSGTKLTNNTINIKTEIEELSNVLEKIYSHKNISIEISFPNRNEGASIQADREDMMELFGNILDNACKWATHKVLITIATEKGLKVSIEDDGIGIEEGKRAELTQRGIRLDEATPGHGLGLSIVTDIIEQYDGTLEFNHSSALGGLKVNFKIKA